MPLRASCCLLLLATAMPAAAATEGAYPRARPLTERRFDATPARLDRGRYLSEHLLQCFICHSERDWDAPGAPPIEARKGAGSVLRDTGDRRVVAPNITPDVETGAGSWTDDMLARAIREGIGHDGRALYWGMWYQSFASLSDEDLAAVVVYLRSLPAVRNPLPRTLLPPAEAASNAKLPRPITSPVPGATSDASVDRGRYLVRVADCVGCHTGWYERNPGLFAGGNPIQRGERITFSSNITPHESGIGYGKDAFITVMRTGKAGSLSPAMPWIAFRGLSDEDLGAIFDALAQVPPVAHYVGNFGTPRHCEVCGQQHALGELNRLVLPKAVPVSPAELERLVGTYRSERFDWTVEVWRVGDRLFGRDQDGAEIELVAQSPTAFAAPGWPAPVEFRIGADGRADAMISVELERIELERAR